MAAGAIVRVIAGPMKGDDGHWRALVEVDGQPAVLFCEPPVSVSVEGSSATWASSAEEKAALADLMRRQ